MNDKELKVTELSRKDIILLVFGVESALFIIALIWSYFSKINPFINIHIGFKHLIIVFAATLILLGVNFLVINVFSKYLPVFQKLKEAYEEMAPISANINVWSAIVVALLSGFAEEYFFRGILQVQFGIIISSIVFGLFHIGSKKTVIYGVYATLVGFYLGLLYLYTGNLLVPISVHILNNFLALLYMKHYYHKYLNKFNN